jgi:hypothetical protein
MNYFLNIKSTEELKNQYRILAKKLHPDVGGNESEFTKLSNEYQELCKKFEISDNYADFIIDLMNLEGIEIEVRGNWTWVYGNTKPHKDILKELGFWWSAGKKEWYKKPDGYKRKSRKNFSSEEIRTMHGSKIIKTNKSSKNYIN